MRAGSHRWRGSPRTRSHSGRSGSCRTAWVPSAANRCSWPPRRLLAFDAELRRHDAFPPFFCVIGIFQPPRRVAARDHVHYACQGAGLIPNPTKTVHYDVITGFIPAVRRTEAFGCHVPFPAKTMQIQAFRKGNAGFAPRIKTSQFGSCPDRIPVVCPPRHIRIFCANRNRTLARGQGRLLAANSPVAREKSAERAERTARIRKDSLLSHASRD